MVRLRHHLSGGGWRRETLLKSFTCLLLLGGLTAASGFKSADKTVPDETLLQHENTSTVPTPETSSISNSPLQHDWRLKRALPDLPISDVYSSDKQLGRVPEGVKKIASKAQSNYIIPYMRPGRSMFSEPIRNIDTTDFDLTLDLKNKRNNTIAPTLRYGRRSTQRQTSFIPYMSFGRSDDIYDEFDSDLRGKKSGTIIPLARYGRDNNYIYESNSELNTEKENVDDIWSEKSDPTDTIDDDNGFNSEVELLDLFSTPSQSSKFDLNESIEKRTLLKKTVIPHPRLGRALDKKNIKKKQIEKRSMAGLKRQSTNLLLPQIRYGRSVDLVLDKYPTKNRQSESEKSQDFILPYPRPGRSMKSSSRGNKVSDTKNGNILLPYPRPGRSNRNLEVVSEVHVENNSDQKRQGYMVPFARLGRSDNAKELDIFRDTEIVKQLLDEETLRDQSLLKMQSKEKNGKNDTEESAGIFIIPYPRPGKRQEPTEATFEAKTFFSDDDKLQAEEKNVKEILLLYPRPGKKESFDKEYLWNQYLKRTEQWNFENESNEDLPGDKKETTINEEILETSEDMEKRNREPLKGSYIVPYPRIGRSNTLVPYPRLGRASDSNFMLPYARLGKKSYGDIIPYPRPGRSSSGSRQQYVLPHPRFGRQSDAAFMLPYPRLGKKNIIPYPRLGRSNSDEEQQYVLPYPRLGRSANSQGHSNQGDKGEYILPLPRLGRSEDSGIMLPYPRSGRSETSGIMLPYPRLGRSESSDIMLPYPRPGRSENSDIMLPYPRPGRSGESDIMLPYPRPGRTKNSDLMPPYPRIGRSKNSHVLLPYPRPGRSETPDTMLPYPRPGRSGVSDIMLPYPRPGRTKNSDLMPPYPRIGRSKNSHVMLPYPRPGRSETPDTMLPYPRPGRSENPNIMLPYPRPGRTSQSSNKYITPYPRLGRSENVRNTSSPNDNTNNNTNNILIPQLRYGRSNHASDYVVPYPRLGRSEDRKSIIPQPRIGRADADYSIASTNEVSESEMNESTYSKENVLSFSDEPMLSETTTEKYDIIPYPRVGNSEKRNDQKYIVPYPRLGRSETNSVVENKQYYKNIVIPYPRLGRSEFEPE